MLDIAKAALAFYGLENAPIRLLRDYENWVYKVEAERTFALRISPRNGSREQWLTEVTWLAAIRNDTDLLVPKPVANRDGDFVSQLGNRLCVLFEWIEGEPVSQQMSPAIATRIGEMMAMLHQHAEHYRPQDYVGMRFDCSYYFGDRSWWQTRARERLSQDYQSLLPPVKKARELLEYLGELPQHFGMSHTDIHFGNAIRNGDDFAIIDFGDCGLSYYLVDIAVTEAEFQDYPKAETLIRHFRSGYQAIRGTIPSNEQIRTAGVMASLLYLEWLFESENDRVREDKAEWLPSIIADMQRAISIPYSTF